MKLKLPACYDELTPQVRRLVREEYVVRQEGKCSHCGELLSGPPPSQTLRLPLNMKLFPPNFLTHPVHLHHSHETGLTIGAVHAYCNGVLWQYHGE